MSETSKQSSIPTAHEHAYRMVAHIDECHAYRSVYSCECGNSISTYDERSLAEDSYSAIWMMDDDGSPMCPRCEQLLNGAEPKHERTETSNQDQADE